MTVGDETAAMSIEPFGAVQVVAAAAASKQPLGAVAKSDVSATIAGGVFAATVYVTLQNVVVPVIGRLPASE